MNEKSDIKLFINRFYIIAGVTVGIAFINFLECFLGFHMKPNLFRGITFLIFIGAWVVTFILNIIKDKNSRIIWFYIIFWIIITLSFYAMESNEFMEKVRLPKIALDIMTFIGRIGIIVGGSCFYGLGYFVKDNVKNIHASIIIAGLMALVGVICFIVDNIVIAVKKLRKM